MRGLCFAGLTPILADMKTTNSADTNDAVIEIKIAEARMPVLVARIAKLNKRGERFGASNALSIESITRWTRNVRFEGRPVADEIAMVTVRIVGKVWTIDGWTFVGRIECTDGGNIVHRAPGIADDVDFETLREHAPHCDHCNTNRRRIDCFVLRGADGTVKLVGRSCLAEYLRDADEVRGALKTAQLYRELGEWSDNWNAPMPGCWGARFRLHVSEFLAFVIAAVRHSGTYERGVTADLADALACGYGDFDNDADQRAAWPTANDFDRAAVIVGWAANMNASNEYMRNLSAAMSCAAVDPRNRNLVASAYIAHENHLNRSAAPTATATAASSHIGTVGERIERMLKVTGLRTGSSSYGTWTLVSLVDRSGNVVKWFAANDRTDDFERGACYKLAGIVKAHGEYRGADETTLTRCRVLAGPLHAAA